MRSLHRHVDATALGPPYDGAGEIEQRGRAILTGHDEVAEGLEPRREVVDQRLEGRDHLGRDERGARLELVAVFGRSRQLTHQHP